MANVVSKSKLVLVEGEDEVRLFGKLTADSGISDIQIQDLKGKSDLGAKIQAWVSATGHEILSSVGVVRDADTCPDAAFQSVANALEVAGLERPDQPMEPAGANPRVVVLILPGGGREGMLETICLESVARDPAMCCVKLYFYCLKKRLGKEPRHPAKARVRAFLASMGWLEVAEFDFLQSHIGEYLPILSRPPETAMLDAFLASKSKPRLDLGIAAEVGYFRLDHEAFDEAKQFLLML